MNIKHIFLIAGGLAWVYVLSVLLFFVSDYWVKIHFGLDYKMPTLLEVFLGPAITISFAAGLVLILHITSAFFARRKNNS